MVSFSGEAEHDPSLFPEYAVVALDASGSFVSWGPRAQRLTGFAPEDVIGRSAANLLADEGSREEGSARFERGLRHAAETGSAEFNVWVQKRDGSPFFGGVSLSAVPTVSQLAGYAMTLVDLTTEAALHQSHAVFEGILAIASDGVVCVDEQQRIIFFNEGAEKIFGYLRLEVLGEPLEMLIPAAHRPGHAAHVRRFAESPVNARPMGDRGSISGLRKSGEQFPADASISKLTVGGTTVFTAVLRDITERRQAEEALARQAAELTRSNRELEQFAYVASHDLQEPLRMVASYTQLLKRRYGDRLDEDAHEFISYAVDGVTRMQALINDLLAYSRVGTRSAPFEIVSVDAILDRVLDALAPAIDDAGATVIREPLPSVNADPVQLGQVLQNLIQNAMKFKRPGVPPIVGITAERLDGEWMFSIEDNGIGIAPEFRDRIFSLFQRLHSRDEYPGTGIGLSICQKIVERHGGRIWIEGVRGEGSTFRFTLPVKASEATDR